MNGLCESSGCSLIARIHVALQHDDRLEVCVPHWGEVLRTHRDGIQGMRLMSLPRCFLHQCHRAAVTVVSRDDGQHLPVCQRHLDNLSWAAAFNAAGAHATAGDRG